MNNFLGQKSIDESIKKEKQDTIIRDWSLTESIYEENTKQNRNKSINERINDRKTTKKRDECVNE